MSILNAIIQQNRALVVADTQLFSPEGEELSQTASKMFPIIGANYVIGGVGNSLAVAYAVAAIVASGFTFDAAAGGRAVETITAAYTGVWAFSAANGQDVWPIQRFLFVGWSDANKRMQMFEVASIDKQPFTLKWHEDVYLHPHITEFPKVPRAEEDLVEYAILQSRGIALEYPGVAGAGGLLMGCELQQDHSLRCSQLADLSLQREPNFARFMDGESACASVN